MCVVQKIFEVIDLNHMVKKYPASDLTFITFTFHIFISPNKTGTN
jgi:hypothetical protein